MAISSAVPLSMKKGRHLYLRNTLVHLDVVLNGIESSIQHLHIYCHSLQYLTPLKETGIVSIVIPEHSKLKSLTIFSCFVFDESKFEGFAIVSSSTFKLKLFFEYGPSPFLFIDKEGSPYNISRASPTVDLAYLLEDSVSVNEAREVEIYQMATVEQCSANSSAAGFEFILSDDPTKIERIMETPNREFQRARIPGSDESFDLTADSSVFGNLAFLLQSLFSEACDLVFRGLAAGSGEIQAKHELKAMRHLSFIGRCTNNSPEYSALGEDAMTLFTRLQLPRQRMSINQTTYDVGGFFFVPTQNYLKYYSKLTRILDDCKAVQNAIMGLVAQKVLTQEIRDVGTKSLTAIGGMAEGYISNEQNYTTALESLAVVSGKRQELTDRSEALANKRADFLKGLDQYQIGKKQQRDQALMMGVGEIAFAFIWALATNPAVLIPTVSEIVIAVKDIVIEGAKSGVLSGGSEPAKHGEKPKPIEEAGKKEKPAPEQVLGPVVEVVGAVTAHVDVPNSWVQSFRHNDPKSNSSLSSSLAGHEFGDPPRVEPVQSPVRQNPAASGSVVSGFEASGSVVAGQIAGGSAIKNPEPVPVHRPYIDLRECYSTGPLKGQVIKYEVEEFPMVRINNPGSNPSGSKPSEGESGVGSEGKAGGKPSGKRQAKNPGEKTAREPSKANQVASGVWTAAKSAGPTMMKAYLAYKNNPILRGRAEAGKQQALNEEMATNASKASDAITASSPSIDYFGLRADWDEIAAGVEELFATLKQQLAGETIRGLEEYRTALINMIARGRALIDAQRQFQEHLRAFYRGVEEMKIRAQRKKEVTAIAESLERKPMALWGYIDDFEACNVVLRRTLMLEIHRCILSLKYRYTRDHGLPIKVSPYLSIDELGTVVQNLQEKEFESGDKVLNKQELPLITIRSDENKIHGVFADNWKAVLLSENKIYFQVPSDFKQVKNVYDVRVLDLSAQFLRSSNQAFTNVDYEAYIGPTFVDRDQTSTLNQYYTKAFGIMKNDTEGKWDFTKLSSEHAPCKPALFGLGYISFDPALGSIDLKEIENLVLAFKLEAVLIPHHLRDN